MLIILKKKAPDNMTATQFNILKRRKMMNNKLWISNLKHIKLCSYEDVLSFSYFCFSLSKILFFLESILITNVTVGK